MAVVLNYCVPKFMQNKPKARSFHVNVNDIKIDKNKLLKYAPIK